MLKIVSKNRINPIKIPIENGSKLWMSFEGRTHFFFPPKSVTANFLGQPFHFFLKLKIFEIRTLAASVVLFFSFAFCRKLALYKAFTEMHTENYCASI